MTTPKNEGRARQGAASKNDADPRARLARDGRRAQRRGLLAWLEALYLGVPGSVELRAIDPETGNVRRKWIPAYRGKAPRITREHLEEGADAILEFDREGLNAYAGIATRARGGGHKSDLGFVRVAWCDVDDPDATPEWVDAQCERFGAPSPSMVVASGGGLHCYWLLWEPLQVVDGDERGRENRQRLEAVNRGIARLLSGDKAATDATRILRPPGTTNRPGPEKRSKGRVEAPVRLLRARTDDADLHRLDDLAPFEAAGLRLVRSDAAERERREPLSPEEIECLSADLRAALPHVGNCERGDWIDVGMALRSSGLPDDVARELWDEWSSDPDSEGAAKFDAEDQDRVWGSFSAGPRAGGVTVSTIFERAAEAGWENPAADRERERRERGRAPAAVDFAEHLRSGAPRPGKREILEEMNERYAYVAIGKGAVVDLTRRPAKYWSLEAFNRYHHHPRFTVDPKRDPVPVGSLWLDWKERRSRVDVDFEPPGSPRELGPDTLNLWQGWGVEADPSGADDPPALFLEHVRNVICGGDEDLYRWVLAWMAHLVQRPWEKPQTAIVMRGKQGAGKGAFGRALVHLCGAHGLHVLRKEHLTGKHNAHLGSRLLIFGDEVTWGGQRQEAEVLKTMVSEPWGLVEPKFVDAFSVRSHLRVVLSTNAEWAIPAGVDERRYLVLDVEPARAEDQGYFAALFRELYGEGGEQGSERPGLARLRAHLESLDLAALPNPRVVPRTDALLAQKLQSLGSVESWIYKVLDRGELIDGDGWPEGWFPRSDLHESYLLTARNEGASRRSAEREVCGKLRAVLGRGFRKTDTVIPGSGGARQKKRAAASLPSLERSRRMFERWIGHEVDWSSASE